ncbi:zinc finger, CCHC-type containing protein [Tanacetum coccineum]
MGDTVKDMTEKFVKLDKFERNDFRHWQKKMHFLLTTLKVVYVLKNDDYICRGHILNGMSDALFDVYQNMGLAKELRDQLESKYMAEDASSKKFLFTQHGLNMDESIYVSSIIDKLPPSWKDFKHILKHNKDELSLVQLESHFHIEETPRAKESGKGKGKEIAGSSSVNMIENVEGSRNEIGPQYSYSYSIEEDPRTFDEAMQSREVAFWKEAINDEMDLITENNTWILSDLPRGCKPLGCKWIFKRKMKVDGTIDKFKARLVIQGFRQKEGIDYFDTYAPVA